MHPRSNKPLGLLSPHQPHLCCGTASTHVAAVEEHSATLREHASECERTHGRTQQKGMGMATRSAKVARARGALTTVPPGRSMSVERTARMQMGVAARSAKVAGGVQHMGERHNVTRSAMGGSGAAADGGAEGMYMCIVGRACMTDGGGDGDGSSCTDGDSGGGGDGDSGGQQDGRTVQRQRAREENCVQSRAAQKTARITYLYLCNTHCVPDPNCHPASSAEPSVCFSADQIQGGMPTLPVLGGATAYEKNKRQQYRGPGVPPQEREVKAMTTREVGKVEVDTKRQGTVESSKTQGGAAVVVESRHAGGGQMGMVYYTDAKNSPRRPFT
ncbi:hypothetical protein DFH07DRAFT_768793 [Mycena maculata]|uniref:Uncharacterized protein n=1 Tax=Mycena maculata TaxID=230809 RepID=A0AAD7JRB9_9AGAR|nr:hypothetical protein DFH07DRAFT_768793 [Mycena maculata]